MDNNSSATVEQLPAIIQKAKENGYEFKAKEATTKPFTMTLPEKDKKSTHYLVDFFRQF